MDYTVKKSDNLTKKDIIAIIEEYEEKRLTAKLYAEPNILAEEGNFPPCYPIMIGWIVSIEDDYKTATIKVPQHYGTEDETMTAMVSAQLTAWCMAWEQPAEYYSTIKESPFFGKLMVSGNDFQTKIPTIQLSNCVVIGAGVLVPPLAACTVNGTANPTPPITKVDPAQYQFTGDYDKMQSTIQTDQDKFLQQPRVSGLWPFNALKTDWRKDEKFIQPGDKVVVLFLNGNVDNAFITDIIEFADN